MSHASAMANTLWPASSCALLLDPGRCNNTHTHTRPHLTLAYIISNSFAVSVLQTSVHRHMDGCTFLTAYNNIMVCAYLGAASSGAIFLWPLENVVPC